jgi:PAS domain S-box-containing protein
MTVSAVHGPEGGLKGLRWLLENVTDRQSARRRLDTQHRITRILAESSTLEEAAPRILHGICENLDWEIGEIWQLDSQAGGLRCLNLWHVPSLDVSEFETTTRTLVLPKGVGLAGRVWEGGEPLWITDLTTGGNLARAPLAKRLGLLRAFGFPIRLGGEILGVILFFTRELRPIDTALLPMFAAIGSQIGQFIERRRAEGALRESEQTFRSIFHGSLDAVAINRLEDGLYVEVNEEFLLLTGYTRDQVIGRLPTEFDIWVDLPNLKTAIMDELRGKRIVRNLEVKFRKRDGTVRQALFSAVMMEIGDDPCILSFARDVTEQKKAEDSLRQLSTRLLNLQDEERRRIALELHDNTAQNLAGLTMNLARVGKSADKLDPKASEALGESLSLAEQCAREVRTVSYRLHPPLLDEMGLASALQLFTEGFSERSGLRVELDLRSDLDPVPPEIQRTLFRIAQEALSNVYRHSGSSTARIRMDRDASSVTLEVSDQGGGFPPGILDATSGTVADLGVGIAGMRERIRQLGGHLEITSTAEGSILTVNLPIVR